MAPVYWLLAAASVYTALGFLFYSIANAAKKPTLGRIISPVLAVAIFAAVWMLCPTKGVMHMIAVFGTVVVYQAVANYALRGNKIPWQEAKMRHAIRRQVMVHLVLLTGSVFFMFPFVWLLSTSVKEDVEINKIPPVWLPTQQVTAKVNGVERKVFTSKYEGQPVRVALIKELNDDAGHRLMSVIEPKKLEGKQFLAIKDDIAEVRHIAPVWSNFPKALKFLPEQYVYGLVPLWNTVQIVVLSILGTIFSCSMVAYSFARLKWPGRDILFAVLLATMMIPGAVTMLPVFLIFRSLGWVDTLKPLWVPSFFGGAFGVFLLRQFFMTIPNDLEDAAKIDGCSVFGIYWRIMLPLIKPALAALGIMSFIGAWGNYMGPLIYISSPEKMPLAYALALFAGQHGGEQSLMMAASTMMMLPVLLVFFFTQRYFIQGITLTGIKG